MGFVDWAQVITVFIVGVVMVVIACQSDIRHQEASWEQKRQENLNKKVLQPEKFLRRK